MWKILLDLGIKLLTLSKELDQDRVDIKEIRRDLLNLTLLVQRLSDEIKLNDEHHTSEREKLVLSLENSLLKLERRLSPPDDHNKNTKSKVADD
jgi:hypothetical protein